MDKTTRHPQYCVSVVPLCKTFKYYGRHDINLRQGVESRRLFSTSAMGQVLTCIDQLRAAWKLANELAWIVLRGIVLFFFLAYKSFKSDIKEKEVHHGWNYWTHGLF